MVSDALILDGYDFDGWFLDGEKATKIMINGDVILKGRFIKNPIEEIEEVTPITGDNIVIYYILLTISIITIISIIFYEIKYNKKNDF